MIALPQATMAAPPRQAGLGGRSPAVAAWLFTVAVFVFLMVVVGGATRLTGSGLSITEWQPVSGALPPLTDEAWAAMFRKYQATSQYRLINQGISLSEFKFLFWWEWAHRLLARWVGVVFAVPFLVFVALRRLPKRLTGRCLALFALGGLQGLVGWWMVKSGLEGRASVAPERLAAHLGLALILLSALVWTGLDALGGGATGEKPTRRIWRAPAFGFAVLVYVQCLMGALVAGNGAGRIDTDWPLMGGSWVPDDYWRPTFWATFAHGLSAVQFNHRLVAYFLLGFAVVMVVNLLRSPVDHPRPKRLALFTLGLVFLQAGLGVSTLLFGDPLWLALAHQANAALLLAAATTLAWRLRAA